MYNKINDIFKLWQRENAPGGQVLVRHKGEIIFDKCYGKAVLEHDIDVTDKTVFHVASVSKQVTIMSLLILYAKRFGFAERCISEGERNMVTEYYLFVFGREGEILFEPAHLPLSQFAW